MKIRLLAIIGIFLVLTLSCCRKISDTAITHPEMTPPSVSVILPEERAATEGTTPETTTAPEITVTAEAPTTPESATVPETTTTESETTPEITTIPETTTSQTTTMSETTTTPETTTPQPTTTTEAATTTTARPSAALPPAETMPPAAGNLYTVNSYNTLNYSEQKGIWITYIELAAVLKNKSRESFTGSINSVFDNVKSLGFNTVYVQVRAFGDAYYSSALFPSGEQYDGTIGGDMDFDPLSVMVKSAHDRGLSIHAWINPMRLGNDSALRNVSSTFLYKQWYNDENRRGKMVVKQGSYWYLNPAYADCVNLITDGIAEILSGYNVDGIQIDDYFYPTTNASFDKSAYAASGTSLSLSDWRYQNVNRMVKKMYSTVHSVTPDAVFGISPQGRVENNAELYADVKLWCSTVGYCDYILPQVYYGFENAGAPYSDTIRTWSGLIKAPGVQLVIGLAPYKIGAADSYAGSGKNEWKNNNNIISRQMADAKNLKNYGGVALYRYDSVFNPENAVRAAVAAEVALIE
ncbi:MAG: family 10 glycosylhydrolase [Ruminococcus sp.]|jgi:uncharacterized lipoprotein YddW (UPF0748 family)|nr:family 10 glycosylhydrolase [Ruminococcus sp.]